MIHLYVGTAGAERSAEARGVAITSHWVYVEIVLQKSRNVYAKSITSVVYRM